MIEFGCKMKEEMKAIQSEIKENIQGTNSEGKVMRRKSMIWNKRKKSTFNQNRMKKQEFKKVKRDLQPLGYPETLQYLNYTGARRRRTTARN